MVCTYYERCGVSRVPKDNTHDVSSSFRISPFFFFNIKQSQVQNHVQIGDLDSVSTISLAAQLLRASDDWSYIQ